MTATVMAALFDVDGTLVDSNYLHAVTWWEAFAQAGHEVPMAAIHRAIGMGSDQLLDALLPASRDRDTDPGIRAAHGALYATYWSRLRPLARAPELLRACRKSGLRVVLASSADPQELAVLRGVLDAEDVIEEALSAADVSRSKPAPDLVQVALRKARIPPRQAVFVGDTVWDVQACQRAGVPCIGLRSGGISTGELLDAGAAAVFATRRICLGQPRDGSLKRSQGSQVASKAAGRPGGGAAAGDHWDGRGPGNPQVAGACSSLGQLHVLAQDYGQRAGVCHAV